MMFFRNTAVCPSTGRSGGCAGGRIGSRPGVSPGGRFLSGVSVLTLSALLVKVIGLMYRIPMLDLLGSEGMGYFNTAYEVYALLCVLSTAGLPVAMSVLISGVTAGGKESQLATDPTVRRIFSVSMGVFLVIGFLGSGALFFLAEPLGNLLGNPASAACIRAISPTVLLICLSGAFRGYFQGQRNMVPTAASQVIEALGKLLLGLLFAGYARGKDLPTATVAAYAVLGLTVGTALSVLYLAVHKRWADSVRLHGHRIRTRSAADETRQSTAQDTPDRRAVLHRLLLTAVPVTVSAGVISLTKCVDLALILRRMQNAGLSAREANELYGCYSTLAVPVFNILPSLTTSVAMSAVPALSAALSRMRAAGEGAERDMARREARRTALSALGMTVCLSVPAGMGLCVFAGDILGLLFSGQPAAVAMATPWLRVLGLSVPAACLITVTGAMLQATGHAGCPVVAMLVGTGVKTVLAYVLLGVPSLGLLGAPISSLVCDTLILAVNALFLTHYAPDMVPGIKQGLAGLLWPLGLSVAAHLPVLALTRWYTSAMTADMAAPLATLLRIAGVVVLYGAGLCIVQSIVKRKNRKKKNRRIENEYREEQPAHLQGGEDSIPAGGEEGAVYL
jgi:stage V sporulation protein B